MSEVVCTIEMGFDFLKVAAPPGLAWILMLQRGGSGDRMEIDIKIMGLNYSGGKPPHPQRSTRRVSTVRLAR
jgi:hypothetical protein